ATGRFAIRPRERAETLTKVRIRKVRRPAAHGIPGRYTYAESWARPGTGRRVRLAFVCYSVSIRGRRAPIRGTSPSRNSPMTKSLLALPVSLALAAPAMAAEKASDPSLQALDARIRALEAEAQKLREQAAQALSEASAARAELDKMKADQ